MGRSCISSSSSISQNCTLFDLTQNWPLPFGLWGIVGRGTVWSVVPTSSPQRKWTIALACRSWRTSVWLERMTPPNRPSAYTQCWNLRISLLYLDFTWNHFWQNHSLKKVSFWIFQRPWIIDFAKFSLWNLLKFLHQSPCKIVKLPSFFHVKFEWGSIFFFAALCL